MTPEELSERGVYLELQRDASRTMTEWMRAMLTFQGFLFTAAVVCTSQHLFWLSLLFVIVGALSCWPWYKVVRLSYDGMAAMGHQYNQRKPKDAPGLDAYNVDPGQFQLFPEIFLPRVIAFIWVLVLAGVLYYWAYPPSLPTK
jgi:hypothetical protein